MKYAVLGLALMGCATVSSQSTNQAPAPSNHYLMQHACIQVHGMQEASSRDIRMSLFTEKSPVTGEQLLTATFHNNKLYRGGENRWEHIVLTNAPSTKQIDTVRYTTIKNGVSKTSYAYMPNQKENAHQLLTHALDDVVAIDQRDCTLKDGPLSLETNNALQRFIKSVQ